MKLKIVEKYEERIYRVKNIVLEDEDGEILAKKKIDEELKEITDSGIIDEKTYKQDDKNVEGKYSLEELYLEAMGYPTGMNTIISWPDSQELMEEPWFEKEAQLINDDFGLEHFGSSAYIIPITRIN